MHRTAARFGEVALALHAARELSDLLSVTARLAAEMFGCELVAVSLVDRRGELLTVSGPAAARVQAEAAADGSPWRRVASGGSPSPLRGPSTVHAPLVPGRGRAVGVLSLYGGAPADDDLARFTGYVAVAVETLWYQNRLRESVEAHRVVSSALGILMERYGVDHRAAYDMLSQVSLEHNVKLRDIAERLIADRTLPGQE